MVSVSPISSFRCCRHASDSKDCLLTPGPARANSRLPSMDDSPLAGNEHARSQDTKLEEPKLRLIAKGLAGAAILVLLAPSAVLASDYISDAAAALAHSSVYVAPGTEGTNNDTAGLLGTRLIKDDGIVLVMLPAGADSSLGSDIPAIAAQLSEKLGGQKIIGLAVGNQVVGYAPALPTGVAADQMSRANSVSNDPITALGTFAQNIHIWQGENPTPTPVPPGGGSGSGSGFPFWLLALLAGALGLIFVGLFASGKLTATGASADQNHFDAPGPVRDLLSRIAAKRDQINDPTLARLVLQICRDIEHYFGSCSADKKADSITFAKSLIDIDSIVAKYIDVQDNRYYWRKPDEILVQVKESLSDYSDYVLESIKNGNEASLREFKLKAYVLAAQREVNTPEPRS